MTDFMNIIAETEGVRTPRRKRTQKEVEAAFAEHKAKRKKSARASAPKEKKMVAGRDTAMTPVRTANAALTSAGPITMIDVHGAKYLLRYGFDKKNSHIHVGFGKSTYAITDATESEFTALEKAVKDPLTDSDAYYRKVFRGRAAAMIPVR